MLLVQLGINNTRDVWKFCQFPNITCIILYLQPISRESPDNAARPLRLVPTIELVKYTFVPHHQHGRRASQELSLIVLTIA